MKIKLEKPVDEYFTFDGANLVPLSKTLPEAVELSEIETSLEIWSCVNHEFSRYYASNFGNFMSGGYYTTTRWGSTIYHKFLFLKQFEDFDGYYLASATTDAGKHVSRFVHRFVMLAFEEPASSNLQVNHKDGNKHNNRLDNLEWCTSQENTHHYYTSDVHKATRQKVHDLKANRTVMAKEGVEKYVDNSEVEEYKKNGWKEGHSDRYKQYMKDLQKLRDDVILYKDNKEILVDRSEMHMYLAQGYELGRKLVNEKSHWMNDGTKEEQIPESQQDDYLSNGWAIGRLRCGESVRWMHKGNSTYLVDNSEIEKYLTDGYQFGKPRRKKPSYTFVIKEGKELQIPVSKLETYQQAGWVEGFLNKHWMNNGESRELVLPEQFQKFREQGYTCGAVFKLEGLQ